MAKSKNLVILIGHLGANPEVKFMPNGNAVANVSIATTDSWKDKNSGNRVESTEWHRLVFFRKLAEIAGEHLKKGAKVCIEGKLKTHKWQDQSGTDHFTTEIVVDDLIMLDGKKEGSQAAA